MNRSPIIFKNVALKNSFFTGFENIFPESAYSAPKRAKMLFKIPLMRNKIESKKAELTSTISATPFG